MEEVMKQFSMDDAFSFVYDNSACEPITPYRFAVYLLIRVLDDHHRTKCFTSKQLYNVSTLLHSLLCAVNLSYPEMCHFIEAPLNKCLPKMFDDFIARVNNYTGDVEVLIRRDRIFHVSRRGDRSDRSPPLIFPKSFLGIFVRKLWVSQTRQTMTENRVAHEKWLEWLKDNRPTLRKDLFGDYMGPLIDFSDTNAEVANVASMMEDIHLNVTPIKDLTTMTSEKLILSSISVKGSSKRSSAKTEKGSVYESKVDVFECMEPPPTNMLFDLDLFARTQPQPSELLSSSRARDLISQQLHVLHVSPDEAMAPEQLQAACEYIKLCFPDLPLVHLVEVMNAIRCRNFVEAENALRQFFDWTMIRVSENGSGQITAADRRPLRYAPLLHARLARIFGQKEYARFLLTEAVLQSQTGNDSICLRLALVELAALSEIEGLDHSSSGSGKFSDLLKTLDKIPPSLLMAMATTVDELTATKNAEKVFSDDVQAFTQQVKDLAALHRCTMFAKRGELTNESGSSDMVEYLRRCAGADYGIDRESQTRLTNEAAKVIAATLKLANGFVEEAVSDCNFLLHFNTGDQWCRRYDTEPQVIAVVNIAYAYAMNGKYSEALEVISHAKERFSEENNWQCARHWKCCESLIGADYAIMFGDWMTAENFLMSAHCYAPVDAQMRKCVLQHCKGYLSEAIDTAREAVALAKKSYDLRSKIRADMNFSMHCLPHRSHLAVSLLEKCVTDSKKYKFIVLEAMAIRRLAYIDVIENRFTEAKARLISCEWTIQTRCTPLENALFHMTKFVLLKRSRTTDGRDLIDLLEKESTLSLARRDFRRASAPLLEKEVLEEAIELFDINGKMIEKEECAAQYCDIDDEYRGRMKWTIL